MNRACKHVCRKIVETSPLPRLVGQADFSSRVLQQPLAVGGRYGGARQVVNEAVAEHLCIEITRLVSDFDLGDSRLRGSHVPREYVMHALSALDFARL